MSSSSQVPHCLHKCAKAVLEGSGGSSDSMLETELSLEPLAMAVPSLSLGFSFVSENSSLSQTMQLSCGPASRQFFVGGSDDCVLSGCSEDCDLSLAHDAQYQLILGIFWTVGSTQEKWYTASHSSQIRLRSPSASAPHCLQLQTL